MDIVLASGNRGKLSELAAMFAGLPVNIRAQSEFGCGNAVESAHTFVENALIKARHAALATGLPVLADDSGLSVTALGGAPGVRSARYAGPQASDRDNIDHLLDALRHIQPARRQCCFICVIVYLRQPADPLPLIATGVWHGRVLQEIQGSGGFGYDPVFHVPDFDCSAAELDPASKNRISHRGQAMVALLEAFERAGTFK